MDERILECPICLEQFKVPTMLPCQHSFCQECILKYIHGKGRFCPVCSQTFQEPDMRKNLLLGQIIDSTNMNRKSPPQASNYSSRIPPSSSPNSQVTQGVPNWGAAAIGVAGVAVGVLGALLGVSMTKKRNK
uniref:RING-type domain-containing protein n=1 Tax=Mesocestoides corti TaxID=53468 RepID=A0A5K3F3L0_MESCO